MWKQSKKPGGFLPNPIILVFQTQTFSFQNCCAPNLYFVMTPKKTNTIHRKEKYSLKKLSQNLNATFKQYLNVSYSTEWLIGIINFATHKN